MSSYYDDEIISYLEMIEMKDFIIISQTNSIVECIMKNFPFKNGRVCFKDMKNEKYTMSNSVNISDDAISFINQLVQEGICNVNDKIIYVGDNLTEYGYEFYLYDVLKIMPYLVNEIPQHHYFLFKDTAKLIFVSFENEIQFGMCN